MKKILFASVLATFFVLGSIAFAGGTKEVSSSKLDAVKKAGKIVLGTSADYPPYEFHTQVNGKDTIVGFDISIAEQVAKDLGVALEIKDMDFDGLLAALVSGNIDIVVAGMTPTEERSKNVDFSDIYYYAEHGVMIRKADEALYAGSASSLKDNMIGAQRGAIQVELAKVNIKGISEDKADAPHAQVKELGKLPDLVMELKNKKIDAIVVELPVARAYLTANPDLMLASYTFKDEDGGNAIAVKKGQSELMAEINKTVARLLKENKVDQFVAEATELVEEY